MHLFFLTYFKKETQVNILIVFRNNHFLESVAHHQLPLGRHGSRSRLFDQQDKHYGRKNIKGQASKSFQAGLSVMELFVTSDMKTFSFIARIFFFFSEKFTLIKKPLYLIDRLEFSLIIISR